MSINSSSSSTKPLYHCSDSRAGPDISTAFIVSKTCLLLPLFILILYLGHQRWRQQRSFATTSHSDIFTYHMAAMELISAMGGTVYLCGSYTGQSEVLIVGYYVFAIVIPGQMSFHILTCVERYLAVVHPVTNLGLRKSGGVRIRNISIVCVWLLCCGWAGAVMNINPPYIPFICSLVFSLIVISFCSLRVLCVLIRPGPGEVGRDRERVDQSKQRAFNTITAIMGVLWFGFVGFIVCLALDRSPLLSYSARCLALISAHWFTLPQQSGFTSAVSTQNRKIAPLPLKQRAKTMPR